MSEAGKEPTGVGCPSRARSTALGIVPGAWGSAGGTAEAVLLGVVAPKIPPTLLLASLSPSWLSGHSLTKLRGCGVVGGPWLSPYHTHYSKGHSKGSDLLPGSGAMSFPSGSPPQERFAAIRGCSSHTMA